MNTLAAIILAVIATPEAPRFLPMTEEWQTNRPIPAAFVASGTFVRGSRVEPEITRETVTNAAAVLSIFDGYWERDQIARCSLTNFVTHGTGQVAVVTNLWHFQEPQWKEVDYLASSYPTNRETSPTVRMVEAARLAQVNDHLGVIHSVSGEDFLTETFGREAFFETGVDDCRRWPDYSWAARYPHYDDYSQSSLSEWQGVLPTFSAVESRDPHAPNMVPFAFCDDCPARRFWTPAWERVLLYYSNSGGQGWQGIDFGLFVHGPFTYNPSRYGFEGWLADYWKVGLEYKYAIQKSGAMSGMERVLKYDVGDMDATNQYRVATQMLGRVYLRQDRNYLGAMNQLLADCEWDLKTPEPDTLPSVASNAYAAGHAYGHFEGAAWASFDSNGVVRLVGPGGGATPYLTAVGDWAEATGGVFGASVSIPRSEPRIRIAPPTWAPSNSFAIAVNGQGWIADGTTDTGSGVVNTLFNPGGGAFEGWSAGDELFFDLRYVDMGGANPWFRYAVYALAYSNVIGGVTTIYPEGRRPTAYGLADIGDKSICYDASASFDGELGATAGVEWTAMTDRDPVECTNAAARALWDCGALTNIEISTAEGRIASTNVWERGGHYMSFDPADSIEAEPHFRCRSGYRKFNATSPYDHAATRRRLLDDANEECRLAAYSALGKIMEVPGYGDGVPVNWVLDAVKRSIPDLALTDLPSQAQREVSGFEAGARIALTKTHLECAARLGFINGRLDIESIRIRGDGGVWADVQWSDLYYGPWAPRWPLIVPFDFTATGRYQWQTYSPEPFVNFTRPVGADVHQGLVERRFWSWHNLRRQ